jgi:FlaA1/EpsC-like NDP-sugar epimerase
MEHPWIGHGPHYDISYTVKKMYSPHSSYLYYFYTIGAIGVGIFIWLLIAMIRMTVRYMSIRTGVNTFATDLLVVVHVQLVVFVLDAIKINFQRNMMYFLIIWLMLGTCAACYRVARDRTLEIQQVRGARPVRQEDLPRIRAPRSPGGVSRNSAGR